MVDKSLIEEVVKINSVKVNERYNLQDNEDIEKYFIEENLNELEKISYILKKGYPIQKAAVRQDNKKVNSQYT